ncbi:hypothetical protein BDP27DRAFT_1421662 [Rhodocollybia butyracea]|uniref:Vacuolar import and degradation protein 21 n=1 Tax=Rhodocollybia butyracea TaxID=206335 RepID=A0A9P5U754_9AGAR|nr:hypothetical protein BDP27DRAFT_1421662 [Rhodocollybia butyracea]
MSEDALESLVEQRLAQLAAISEKRNALLREMYRMLRKRMNAGETIAIDDEESDDLHVFLNKHDLTANPETGYISHLSENELFCLVSPEEPPSSPQPISSESKDVADGNPPSPVEQAVEHLDSDDELDIIRSSPQPNTLSTIPISGSMESTQVVSVGTAGIASELDNSMRQSSLPNPEDIPGEPPKTSVTSPESTDGVLESVDLMDVDNPAISPPSQIFSAPQVPRDRELPQTTSPLLEQPRTPPAAVSSPGPSVNMDIDLVVSLTAESHTIFPESGVHPNPPVAPPTLSFAPSQPREFTTPEPIAGKLYSAPVFIPAPSSAFHSVSNDFDFTTLPLEPPPAPPVSPSQPRHQLDLRYPLPPLDALPADFKVKSRKIKSKKKEKADAKKEKEGKDDWAPWGLNRWNATIRTNPVYKRVSKATKCLSTRDWAVAMTELKVIRAVDRIELLKSSARWSFRQPKKQRASGGITKTHWDYLMDEMKWMRTDFREERKWKMTIAYNLSTSVLEWHAAGTPEKRLKRGICVHWKPPRQDEPKDQIMEDATQVDPIEAETPATSGPTRPSSALLNLDYGSDDEDDEDQEKDVDDGLDPSAMVEESLDQSSFAEGVGFKDLQPKTEEIEDASALHNGNMEVDNPVSRETHDPARSEEEKTLGGLKSTSDDPILALSESTSTSLSSSLYSERSSISHSKSSKINRFAPLRDKIAHSDTEKVFLDLDDFRIPSTDPLKNLPTESVLPHVDLSSIFPEAQIYGMFDVAVLPPPDGLKKKGEKKSDRDDPVNRRVDEVAYSKVYPASNFMHSKPTLVGALKPSKHMRDGKWVGLDETPISVEYEGPQAYRLPEEFNAGLFDHKVPLITIVTPALSPPTQTPAPSSPVAKLKEPSKRVVDHIWTSSDDMLLKSLAEKYPNNWALVAECYNASKVTIKADWRTSKDCQERWRERFSPTATQRLLETEPAASPSGDTTPPPPSLPGTRGVKRPASASVSMSSAPTTSGSGSEPKKRRRHTMVQDAVRKAIKKRNEVLQKNSVRKSAGMHESHNDYSGLQKMSPAEVSRRKADRDHQQNQELQLARARALAGPNGASRASIQPAAPAVAVGANGAQRASISGAPAQPVAQIRSQQVPISQQQRSATPLIAGNSRMSPQQQQQLLASQVQRAQQANATAAQGQTPAQVQVQAQLALLAQHSAIDAQATLRGNLQQALVQNGVNGTASLSSPYTTSRDATSSPAHASSPRSTGTPSNGTANSPRPLSAQAQHPQSHTQPQGSAQPAALLQNGQIGAMNIPQARNIQGHYYLPNVSSSVTPEQLSMLRLQVMVGLFDDLKR